MSLQNGNYLVVQSWIQPKEHRVLEPRLSSRIRLLVLIQIVLDASIELIQELVDTHAVDADRHIVEKFVAVRLLEEFGVLRLNEFAKV